uniref:CNT-like nucleoside transporter n=1 Tax=Caenorhabditis elegans TaxID=6239 RepID=Q9NDD4_CAEEL|nr:CNT-like nucleoside transporter [Caenorhabditis elegans]
MKISDVEENSTPQKENVLQRSCSLTSKSLQNNLNIIEKFGQQIRPYFGIGSLLIFLVVYHGFLVAAGIHNYQKAAPLIYVTLFFWICYLLNLIVGTKTFRAVYDDVGRKLEEITEQKKFVPLSLKIAFIFALLAFTIIDSIHDLTRLTGFFAYVFYILFMFVFSNNRMKINWSVVSSALIMHYCVALIILKWSTGQWFFQKFAELIVGFLEFAQVGAKFVFGFIAGPPNICDLAPVFIFTSLQTLIYFSAVVALLFYFGIIQVVLQKSQWTEESNVKEEDFKLEHNDKRGFMKVLIGTTPVESVNAWACTFLGMSEAPLMVAPYIEKLTDSEIFAIVTSGFACVAGTVFTAYVALGACPIYLLTASLLSAPMSLACSKIMFPEFFDTLCSAGVALVPTVFAIGATLVVIMSLLAFLDAVMEYIGDLIGYDGWTFQMLFGYAFFPLAYMMGVNDNSDQTLLVAQLMGTKTAVNEFVAYNNLGILQKAGKLQPKSVVIATYALCGFSNFSSMGMSIEFLGGLAPSKRSTISKLVLRALCAGSIACFMNATVAGILISSPVICQSSQKSDTCFRIPSG